MTLVSIVVPAYDAEPFIGEALDSLAAQTYREFEILVVDDGSRDRTARLVTEEAERDSRIRLLSIPHSGVAAARNAGVRAARGSLVSFLDADDLWRPDRLERHVSLLGREPATDLIVGEVLVFEALSPTFEPVLGSDHVQLRSVNLGAATIRSTVFDAVGVFDETMRFSEDLDFLLRVHEAGMSLAVESEVALLYRRHDANMTNDADANRRYILRALHHSLARRRDRNSRPPAMAFPLQTRFDELTMSPADVGNAIASRRRSG
ncbi:glycosyltransferase family A protein [Kaistia defluvii]|uniref:glycosyltransferase family 2 protein n=1 Tax=Kaistia defluvii TaxID=410841 RepID=UPI002256EE53|nr:glycosyltransferase family A protein [Kaistia defluvii]MCX5518800.1 glycosyltransferase family A protein [Kaistia defluvii]